MFFNTCSFQVTTVLVALAANACAVHGAGAVESAAAKLGCVGGVIQTAADAELYGACEHVNGDLRISARELSDLSTFSRLRTVSGKLEIAGSPRLEDLSGLERLEQVGALSVHDNAELDDLSGLQNLHQVSAVAISDNAELASLRGLEGLTRVEALVIERNGLYQATGLSNLSEVGTLVVDGNTKLNSLQGLGSLSHARSVEIRNNPRLCARGMLPALARVDRAMTVAGNRGLSRPEVHQLLGRIEHVTRPDGDSAGRMEASLR